MTTVELRGRFPTLTSDNWYTWKVDCKALLQQKGTWHVVSGALVRPVADNVDKPTKSELREQQEWDLLDMQARGLIASNVQEAEYKAAVVEADSAKAGWDSLVVSHERKGFATIIRIKTAFFRYEKPQQHSLSDQIADIKLMTRQLQGVGRTVTEEDKVVLLLATVDKSYSTVISGIMAGWDLKTEVHLDFDTVCQSLLNEEVRLGRGNTGLRVDETSTTTNT